MSVAPTFGERDFDGNGGECWWVCVDDQRITLGKARQWCEDNGVAHFVFGDRHFNPQLRGNDRFTRWIGFVFEDDALMFYLAHG